MSEEKSLLEDVSFHSDGLMLKGILHLPAAKQPPLVIGSHGLFSSSSSPKQIALANQCNRMGIAYFRFDHRGCGHSQGEFETMTSLEARCRDLTDAAATIMLRSDIGKRIGLFGSSMGGTVCLMAASKLNVTAMVIYAAPIRGHFPENRIRRSPNFFDDAKVGFDSAKGRFDISHSLPKHRNILIIHGQADDVVPLEHAREIYKLAQDPKKLILQKNGDHPMSKKIHQKAFVEEASLWFKQKLNAN